MSPFRSGYSTIPTTQLAALAPANSLTVYNVVPLLRRTVARVTVCVSPCLNQLQRFRRLPSTYATASQLPGTHRLVEAPLTLELARTRVPAALRRLQPCLLPSASNPAPKRRPSAAPTPASAATPDALPTQLRPDAVAPAADASLVLPPPSAQATVSPAATPYALRLDVPACQAQLSLLRDTQATCCHVASRLLGRPVGLSSDAHVEALCMREHLVRRRGRPPLDLAGRCAVELHSRRVPSWHVFVPKDGLPHAVRHRAAQLGVLATRHVAARALAEVLQGLLVAAGVVDGGRGSEDAEHRSKGHQPVSEKACAAGGAAVDLSAAVGVVLHRAGLEGGMAVRTAGSTGQGGPGAAAPGGSAAAGATAQQCPVQPDEVLVVTELSSAPHPAPSLQQQYCAWPEGEAHLQVSEGPVLRTCIVVKGRDAWGIYLMLPCPHVPVQLVYRYSWRIGITGSGPGQQRPRLLGFTLCALRSPDQPRDMRRVTNGKHIAVHAGLRCERVSSSTQYPTCLVLLALCLFLLTQARLPLPVIIAEPSWPPTGSPRPEQHLTAAAPALHRLRPGLLVALAGPGPRAALDFDAGGGADG